MFSIGEAVDRETVRGEGGRADRCDTGKGGQDLTVGVGEQRRDLDVESFDVCSEPTVSAQIAVQPLSAVLSIGGRRQTFAPPLQPVVGGVRP